MPEVAPDPTGDPVESVGCWIVLIVVILIVSFVVSVAYAFSDWPA